MAMVSIFWISRFFFLGALAASCSQVAPKQKKEIPAESQPNSIAPVSRTSSQENSLELFLKESSADFGFHKVKSLRNYAVDLNNDGASDLVTLSHDPARPKFWLFDKATKQFQSLPIIFPRLVSFLVFADFNNDKILDIVASSLPQRVAAHSPVLEIYWGELSNGIYSFNRRPTRPLGKISPLISTATVADFNGDGLLDLFLGLWFQKGKSSPGQDIILLNQGEKNFTAESKLFGEKPSPTYGSSICDFDQNGLPDLLLATSFGHPNLLFLSFLEKGVVYFREVGKQSKFSEDNQADGRLRSGGNSLTSVCADYNQDGAWDLFTGEHFDFMSQKSRDQSVILTGTTLTGVPQFLRTGYERVQKLGPGQKDERALWLDFTGDGLLDLVIENSLRSGIPRLIFFQQLSDHSFSEVTFRETGIATSPSGTIIMDVNGDHLPDLLTGATGKDQFLRIFLNQSRPNAPKSLSAKIGSQLSTTQKIQPFKREQYFLNPLSGGFPSQNESKFYFHQRSHEIWRIKSPNEKEQVLRL